MGGILESDGNKFESMKKTEKCTPVNMDAPMFKLPEFSMKRYVKDGTISKEEAEIFEALHKLGYDVNLDHANFYTGIAPGDGITENVRVSIERRISIRRTVKGKFITRYTTPFWSR